MKPINVNRQELLTILRTNRENHRAIFLEAQDGFRKLAIEKLEESLADARAGKKINRFIQLTEPVDQTKDYDRIIKMLEMSQDDTVALDEQDFAQYVQDDWHWRRQFLTANSVYSATAAGMMAQSEDE